MSNYCSNIGIPSHLHENGRAEDQVFGSSEKLYRRFFINPPKESWIGNKQLSAKVFALENDSYNREKYSQKPSDVLYNKDAKNPTDHFFNAGIIEIVCNKILEAPYKVELNNVQVNLTFSIVHKPEKCIYPHSEVHAFKDEVQIPKVAPKSYRTAIRDILIEEAEVIKEPKL